MNREDFLNEAEINDKAKVSIQKCYEMLLTIPELFVQSSPINGTRLIFKEKSTGIKFEYCYRKNLPKRQIKYPINDGSYILDVESDRNNFKMKFSPNRLESIIKNYIELSKKMIIMSDFLKIIGYSKFNHGIEARQNILFNFLYFSEASNTSYTQNYFGFSMENGKTQCYVRSGMNDKIFFLEDTNKDLSRLVSVLDLSNKEMILNKLEKYNDKKLGTGLNTFKKSIRGFSSAKNLGLI